MRGFGDVAESAIVIVVEKSGAFGFVRKAKIFRRDITDTLQCVAGDENVGPAVVVVIKEPGGEAEQRFGDAGGFGYISEVPWTFWIFFCATRPVISKED